MTQKYNLFFRSNEGEQPSKTIKNLDSLTFFAKKYFSSNAVLAHCLSTIYDRGLKPHWKKMQKLSKN